MADINNLANLDKNTGIFQISTDEEIYLALVNAFKKIYGEDIVISKPDADGQYVTMETNILSNIYSLVRNLYQQFNLGSAKGNYLDLICAFSNVFRKRATFSYCYVYVKNTNVTQFNDVVVCSDRSGVTWRTETDVEILPNEIKEVKVICDSLGKVTAKGNYVSSTSLIDWTSTQTNGYIYQPVETNGLLIYQSLDAVPGRDTETDEELRYRKLKQENGYSQTTDKILKINLEFLDGIKSAYVFNNSSGSDSTMTDEAVISNHNVYVVLEYEDGYDTEYNETIGTTIYNNMTPGVYTNGYTTDPPYNNRTGTQQYYDINIMSNIYSRVYWKKIIPISLEITIKIKYKDNYIRPTSSDTDNFTSSEQKIVDACENVFGNIGINEELNYSNLSSEINTNLNEGIVLESMVTDNRTTLFNRLTETVSSTSINYGIMPKLTRLKYKTLVLDNADNTYKTNYHFVYDTTNKIITLTIDGTLSALR